MENREFTKNEKRKIIMKMMENEEGTKILTDLLQKEQKNVIERMNTGHSDLEDYRKTNKIQQDNLKIQLDIINNELLALQNTIINDMEPNSEEYMAAKEAMTEKIAKANNISNEIMRLQKDILNESARFSDKDKEDSQTIKGLSDAVEQINKPTPPKEIPQWCSSLINGCAKGLTQGLVGIIFYGIKTSMLNRGDSDKNSNDYFNVMGKT